MYNIVVREFTNVEIKILKKESIKIDDLKRDCKKIDPRTATIIKKLLRIVRFRKSKVIEEELKDLNEIKIWFEEAGPLFTFSAYEWYHMIPVFNHPNSRFVVQTYKKILNEQIKLGHLKFTYGYENPVIKQTLYLWCLSPSPGFNCIVPDIIQFLDNPPPSITKKITHKLNKKEMEDAFFYDYQLKISQQPEFTNRTNILPGEYNSSMEYRLKFLHPISSVHKKSGRLFKMVNSDEGIVNFHRSTRNIMFEKCPYCRTNAPCHASPETPEAKRLNGECGWTDEVRFRCFQSGGIHLCNAHGAKIICNRKLKHGERHQIILKDGRKISNIHHLKSDKGLYHDLIKIDKNTIAVDFFASHYEMMLLSELNENENAHFLTVESLFTDLDYDQCKKLLYQDE